MRSDNQRFYEFNLESIKGENIDFSILKDKVVLIVNVASKCGFTKQYEGLQQLYQRYEDQGFEIIGCPCNQFGSQEPGGADEISNFCSTTYGVSFPITEKIEVNGKNAHPLYRWLTTEKKGLMGLASVKWNFTKFLVDHEGQVVGRYAPTTKPSDIEKDLEALLKNRDKSN